MKITKICKTKSGVFTFFPKLIKFNECGKVGHDDIEHLFMGLFRLLKATIREEVEHEYVCRIKRLEKELLFARQDQCTKNRT